MIESNPSTRPSSSGIVFFALLAGLLLVSLAACDREGDETIRTTEVPKGSEPIAPDDEVHEQRTPPIAAQPSADEPRWTVPETWTRDNEPREARYTTFMAEDEDGPVEVAVTRFPGDVGGMLANVNRWRGQVGRSPVTQQQVTELVELFDLDGFEGYQLHIEGVDRDIVVSAVFEPAANRTWFVRVLAQPAVAHRVAPQVFEFAQSFQRPGY